MIKKPIRNTFLDDLQNHRIITIKIDSIRLFFIPSHFKIINILVEFLNCIKTGR